MIAAFDLWPRQASEMGSSVDAIFITLLVVCGLVTLGIFAFITFFCIRYRKGSPARHARLDSNPMRLEILWTSLTLLAFLGIFAWAAVVYFRMSQPVAGADEIHVVAKQWMWKLQHANGRREINELHLLAGRPVRLVMISQDVIHDFYVPAFRNKQDVLPNHYTTEWFTPTLPGRYRLFCAEYCGMDHSAMGGWVTVMNAGDYARWLAEGETSESMAAAGARLFTQHGCSGCHGPNAAVRAPSLAGVYNRTIPLADGRMARADERYLYDSIVFPNKEIAAGYEALMPTYQGQLGEDEIMQIIAFLRSGAIGEGRRP